MSDGQRDRSDHSDDSLWEALDQCRQETERARAQIDQRLEAIGLALAAQTERLTSQQPAASPAVTPVPPPPYPLPQVVNPLPPQAGLATRQTFYREAAQNIPAWSLDFQV